MKQKDIALIIVIAFVSAVASFLVSDKLFVKPSNRAQQAEVVDPINASFQTPSKTYFNPSSVDPTQAMTVVTDTNQNPFSGGGGK